MGRTLLLDMMGVLLVDPYVSALEAGARMPVADIAAVRDPQAWPRFERAEIDEAEFARAFFADGRPFDLDAFNDARRAGYAFVDGMERLVDDLTGAEIHIASNYPVWIAELAERFGFAERFDGVHASCHLGVRKPHPAFFDRLLDRIGRRPGDCWFVDDRADNCAAAAAAGISAHVFRDAATCRRWLRAEGFDV